MKIIKAKSSNNPKDRSEILCLIEWKEIDNTKPLSSYVSNKELRLYHQELLFKFYENRITFNLECEENQRKSYQLLSDRQRTKNNHNLFS